MQIVYILLAIFGFGILIFVHEFGHFVAAKACNVKVLEFSLGMGPAIFKKQGKETLFSLRVFPIGGFCAMEGEDEDTGDERAFSTQSPWKKMIILVAGAAMNFIFGFLFILIVFSQAAGFSTPTITEFMEGCPYEGENALMVGDTIHEIDGHRIYFTTNVSTYMTRSGSDVHDIVVVRDGRKVQLNNFKMPLVEYQTEDGGTEMKYGLYFGVTETGFWSNVKYSWYCALDFVRLVWESLGDLISGAVGFKDMAGPVGVVDAVSDVATQSEGFGDALNNIMYFFALIAINLAVMNLLPIPALDGGRVFFLLITSLIELFTRKKLNPKYEGYIHTAGFVLLIGLSIVVMFNDVLRIFRG